MKNDEINGGGRSAQYPSNWSAGIGIVINQMNVFTHFSTYPKGPKTGKEELSRSEYLTEIFARYAIADSSRNRERRRPTHNGSTVHCRLQPRLPKTDVQYTPLAVPTVRKRSRKLRQVISRR